MQKTHEHAIISLEADLVMIEEEMKENAAPIPEYSRKHRRLVEVQNQFVSAIRILKMIDDINNF